MHNLWLRAGRSLVVAFCCAAAALLLWMAGVLDPWEARTWDFRVKLLARPGKATDDIRLILLDQNSLDWARQENGINWPWPRELYGAVADFCRRNGARALAFDVLFTEPSAFGVQDDAALGESLSRYGRTTGSVFLARDSGSLTAWPQGFSRKMPEVSGLTEWLSRKKNAAVVFPRAAFPIPEVAEHSTILCNVNLAPDPDGVYRRAGLFALFDGRIFPSPGLGAYLAANPESPMALGPDLFSVGGRAIPVDTAGRAILNFRGPSGTHRTVSAAAVIQSEIRLRSGEAPAIRDENLFRDKFVIFGFSAPGLYDLRSSPAGGVYTGAEIHATFLDNLLSEDFFRPFPRWGTAALAIFLAAAGSLSLSVFTGSAGTSAIFLLFVLVPVLLSMAAYRLGFWLPLVVLEAAAAGSLSLSLAVNYATEGKQKRFIKQAFRQYLSPVVVEQLIRHPERLKLGGERRILSIFFSDLQGFTSISESLGPEELTTLLNDYLSEMTEIIQQEGGTVDKYEGDAIIAFWNAPLPIPDHAERVVRAALRCQARLAQLRPGFRERMGKDLFMRIGMNTGPAVVGNLGSHTRFDYTMLGDSVNLAARLEGVNKEFGTYTMISQSTREALGDAFGFRELGRVAVVGKKEPVRIYEPMERKIYEEKKPLLDAFSRGLSAFYQGRFEEALDTFLAIESSDPPSRAYAEKCREMMKSPPVEWEGVWVMTRK